jgi:hypothetical protein
MFSQCLLNGRNNELARGNDHMTLLIPWEGLLAEQTNDLELSAYMCFFSVLPA